MKKIILAAAFVSLFGYLVFTNRSVVENSEIEISREQCIHNVRNNGSPFRPGKQCSLELSKLIQLFLPLEAGMSLSWEVAADSKTPINWKTSGRSLGCNGTLITLDSPERCGEIFVTENGIIDHTILEKTVQPGLWSIKLYGSNAGVDKIEFYAESDIGLNHLVTNLKNDNNVKIELIAKNDPWYGSTLKEDLYELNAPEKQKAWLKDEMSCGVSGRNCSFTLTIFHSLDRAIQSLQYQSH